jgi:hypothetical protein
MTESKCVIALERAEYARIDCRIPDTRSKVDRHAKNCKAVMIANKIFTTNT